MEDLWDVSSFFPNKLAIEPEKAPWKNPMKNLNSKYIVDDDTKRYGERSTNGVANVMVIQDVQVQNRTLSPP